MARTLIDVDDEALAVAMAEFQTTTKVETVNRALREIVRRRESNIESLMETALFISDRLAESDVRAVAWR